MKRTYADRAIAVLSIVLAAAIGAGEGNAADRAPAPACETRPSSQGSGSPSIVSPRLGDVLCQLAKSIYMAGRAGAAVSEVFAAFDGQSVPEQPETVEADLELVWLDRKTIQSGLAYLGFDPGPIDGMFGPLTRAALRSWQKAMGAEATGWLTLSAAEELKTAGERAAGDRPPTRSSFRDCADCPTMVVVPSGSFTMGSPPGEKGRARDEGPRHRVTIGRRFAVGKYEVTVEEFAGFVEATRHVTENRCWTYENAELKERSGRGWRTPGFSQDGRHPVTCVSWRDARAYVRWLSAETGQRYRLLTEAEWEYAARAGTPSRYRYHWGNLAGTDRAHCEGCGSRFANDRTAPVGSFGANALGLHDMHGNIWEWVEDCWHGGYRGMASDGGARTTGGNCAARILRGGAWNSRPDDLRAAHRVRDTADARYFGTGFRVARTLGP